MKHLMIAALVAAQVSTSAPAASLDVVPAAGARIGAFAGARLYVPLGAAPSERARVGLALVPMTHSFRRDGSVRRSVRTGLELGLDGSSGLGLSFAGMPIDGRGAAPQGPRNNISTIGWIGIGVGVLAVATLALFQLCADGEVCGSDRDD